MTRGSLRVAHVSAFEGVGGAARAARSLHEAMLNAGIDSIMVVGRMDGNTQDVQAPHPRRFAVAGELDRRLWRLTSSPRLTWRSPALFGSLRAADVHALGADIINLHWITNGLLSVREIGQFRSPTVWSMYDMWPFSGSEHYHADPQRYQNSYSRESRPADESGLDLDRWTWKRKRRHWQKPFTMVPASRWLEAEVRSSSLMRGWPVSRIPHLIDLTTHRPGDQKAARDALGLPQDTPLIAFLATAGITDSRKGWEHLRAAVSYARTERPEIEVVVIGPTSEEAQPFPVHWLKEIRSDTDLHRAYAAVDIVATPSIQDTMPLAAMEAQASARAVVGFEVGGLPDIVEHGVTGLLAEPLNAQSLSVCLVRALEQAHTFGSAGRARAERLWGPTAVMGAYLDVYEELLGKPRS